MPYFETCPYCGQRVPDAHAGGCPYCGGRMGEYAPLKTPNVPAQKIKIYNLYDGRMSVSVFVDGHWISEMISTQEMYATTYADRPSAINKLISHIYRIFDEKHSISLDGLEKLAESAQTQIPLHP